MSKLIGDIGELEFIIRAKKLGYTALLPYSAACVYDIAIDNGDKIIKIQVKTINALSLRRGERVKDCYKTVIGKGRDAKSFYGEKDVDFFAIYIMKINKFFILPFAIIESKTSRFYPEKKDHKFSKYLEKWDLLK